MILPIEIRQKILAFLSRPTADLIRDIVSKARAAWDGEYQCGQVVAKEVAFPCAYFRQRWVAQKLKEYDTCSSEEEEESEYGHP